MSAWAPTIVPISSVAVQSLLDNRWAKYENTYVTRSLGWDWKMKLAEELKNYVPILKDWLEGCIRMPVDYYPLEDLLSVFISVQFLSMSQQHECALQELARVQKQLDQQKFGLDGIQQTQHNFHHYLAGYPSSDSEADEDESMSSIVGTGDGDNDRPQTPVQPVVVSPSGSPNHKRQKKTHSSISFEEFTRVPVTVGNRTWFNKWLAENSPFWLAQCTQWTQDLRRAYTQSNNSGLAEVILHWTDPTLICATADFVALLIRKTRVSESFGTILLSWTPHIAFLSKDNPVQYHFKVPGIPIHDGLNLIKAIKTHPDVIPRHAIPSSVFFLLNMEKFLAAARQWLFYTLHKKGYDLLCINDQAKLVKLYNSCTQKLEEMERHHEFEDITDRILQLVFIRTRDFRKLRNSLKYSTKVKCKECARLPKEKHCIQRRLINYKKADNGNLGNGVSLVPPEHYMEPIPIPHSKGGQSTEHKPIVHPSVLNLTGISYDNDILDRCGRQVVLFVDQSNPTTVLDFWVYDFLSTPLLSRLQSHHSHFQNVKQLARGWQFNSYSQGAMFGKGARAPMGGAPGDGYTYYAGMDAITPDDIDALFNDAEDGLLILESARIWCPKIYKDLKALTVECEHLGISGTNIFSCNNYTSPLHHDNDAGHGLCVQTDLQAHTDYWEYSFIYADYGIYMRARANSLWSFSGADTHGTMLPGNPKTLLLQARDHTIGPDGPDLPRVSNGKHKITPKANIVAAKKYSDARAKRGQVHEYWCP